MKNDPDLAHKIINAYVNLSKRRRLLASEFLIYCAIISACNNAAQGSEKRAPIPISRIFGNVPVSRETVRRSVLKLEYVGLISRVNRKWIYN